MSHCPLLTPVGCGLQARQQPPSLGPPFLGVEGGSACELGPRSTGWAANSLPPGPGSTPALPTYRPCPFVIFPAPAPRPGLLLPLGLPAPRSHPQVSSVSRGSGHPSAAGACLVRVSPTPGDIHFPPRSAPGSAGPPGPHLQPTLGPFPSCRLLRLALQGRQQLQPRAGFPQPPPRRHPQAHAHPSPAPGPRPSPLHLSLPPTGARALGARRAQAGRRRFRAAAARARSPLCAPRGGRAGQVREEGVSAVEAGGCGRRRRGAGRQRDSPAASRAHFGEHTRAHTVTSTQARPPTRSCPRAHSHSTDPDALAPSPGNFARAHSQTRERLAPPGTNCGNCPVLPNSSPHPSCPGPARSPRRPLPRSLLPSLRSLRTRPPA